MSVTALLGRPAAVGRGLLLSAHPGPVAAVTAFATAIALGAGVPAGTAFVLAIAALAGQLSIGWSNDWLDAARDRAVGRKDKPVAAGLVSVAAVRRAALLALTACVPASLALGWRAGLLHLAAVVAAWSYNLRLKSTVWSWVPYAFSFGALPSVATLTLPGHPWAPAWATGAGALLGVGAHLANVAPDLLADRATGIVGLAHRIGRTATGLLAAATLLAATILVVLGPAPAPRLWSWAGLAVAAALTALATTATLTSPSSRLPFTASIAVAGVDVALLVVAGSSLA